MTSYTILDSQIQSRYVFVHVSIIVWSKQLNRALRTLQQSFVDQNQISESSTNLDFSLLHVYSDQYLYLHSRRDTRVLNKISLHYIIEEELYQKLCHSIRTLFNIEVILSVREFFRILFNYLANRLFSSVFTMLCQYCNSELPKTLTTRQHYQQSDTCSETIRHRIAQYDAIRHRLQEVRLIRQEEQKKVALTRQDAQKRIELEVEEQKKVELIEQEAQKKAAKRAEAEIIEVVKSTSTSVNIDIFDSTLIRDIEKFDLYSKVIDFLKHLQQIQHQDLYRESDVLDLLLKCVRSSAFAWFKDQIFIIIQDFDRDLACAFSIISLEFASKTLNQSFTTSASHSSSQYHLCVECFAQFSSMTRLLNHIKQVSCSKVICKHCEQDFNFKNKLHDHIRELHTQKSVTSFVTSKNSNLRSSTSEFTYKIKKKLSVNSLTSSTSSSSTSVRKHQKLYLTIDDLSRMFRGKSRSFDLRQYQKDSASSQRFDISSSRQ